MDLTQNAAWAADSVKSVQMKREEIVFKRMTSVPRANKGTTRWLSPRMRSGPLRRWQVTTT